MRTPTTPGVGILLLDTRFPRVLGDIGNKDTWPFPVRYKTVDGATPEAIVQGDPRELLGAFVAAAQELIREGVQGITTTCGFLSLLQDDLKSSLAVPVATSALMQIPLINALLPPAKRAGVITISRNSLSTAHLLAAGAPIDTPVIGTDGSLFSTAILGNSPELDTAAAQVEIRTAAQELCQRHPDIGALVLECTNMPPYAAAVAKATGLPVYSIYSFVSWFQSGLRPRIF
ncbi:MAG: aspartate/glutamate racemase family protein [Roseobacter sp.]|nr:aspartate/glutamate racemase family protein [Roseobacter sp.]